MRDRARCASSLPAPTCDPTKAADVNQGKALLLVFDGLGFSRERAAQLIEDAWVRLPQNGRSALLHAADSVSGERDLPDAETLARTALYPVAAEALDSASETGRALAVLEAVRTLRSVVGDDLLHNVAGTVRETAAAARYAPWAARMPHLAAARNANLTVPTAASGRWVGFEDLNPPVQGNSDTGHQQIGNFRMAPQTPLRITDAIESGEFFENTALLDALDAARESGTLNFCFMISGAAGHDGRVHSAWNHLEAFLELAFEKVGLPPERVRMQAILDGRDCPTDSSITAHGETGDYLGRLQRTLDRHGAVESLVWVVGRNIAMDRDYREENARADYLLLTKGAGKRVDGFDGTRAAIAEWHATGAGDSDMPPTVVNHGGLEAPLVEAGDVFVNLNFRADRQRAKTASLLGAVDFLREMSADRGDSWSFDWLMGGLRLRVCTLADYHPALVEMGARPAFTVEPQQDNLLALFPRLLPGETYSLVGESNKAAHMGFFIRGSRESPVEPEIERRTIMPSTGPQDGVHSDTDFYKTPSMRSPEIAGLVVERMAEGRDRLVCANLSNCDMLGHLLPGRFEAAVAACEAVDEAVGKIVRAAVDNGYHAVLTSDHGNVENDSPAHSANDVLTTIVPALGSITPALEGTYRARLFDISWTLAELMGVGDAAREIVPSNEAAQGDGDTIGRPLARIDTPE